MSGGEKKTEFAMKAASLAEWFAIEFGEERLVVGGAAAGKGATYRIQLASPEGDSTGGGKQSLQPIKLAPEEGTTIVVGGANQVEQTVELRTWEYLAFTYAQRFKGQRIPIGREQYNELFQRLQAFFTKQRLRLRTTDAPPGSATASPDEAPPADASGKGIVIALLVAIFVVGAVAIALMLKRRATHALPPAPFSAPQSPTGAAP